MKGPVSPPLIAASAASAAPGGVPESVEEVGEQSLFRAVPKYTKVTQRAGESATKRGMREKAEEAAPDAARHDFKEPDMQGCESRRG
jgi:hypothetical protein